ncbi:MAG: terminase small subunit [Ruminococcus sp.]|nr:terminase small subunit [Ruminococcus sp.]
MKNKYEIFAYKYSECGNIYEAAKAADISPLDAVAMMINAKVFKKAKEFKQSRISCPASEGLRRIAFGRNNDAVKLAFSEEVTPQMIENLDLYGVSEIKCGKGVVEIKFFDRQKALDALYLAESEQANENSAENLITAIYGKREDDMP